MSALLNSIEHALASAASDVVKVAKFVEQSVLPVLKKAQADAPTIASGCTISNPGLGDWTNGRQTLRVKSGSNVQDFKNVKEADPNRCTEGEALSVS